MDDTPRPSFEHRLQSRKDLRRGADHRVEHAFPRFLRRTRQRRVDERDVVRLQLVRQRHCAGRIRCGAIDNDRAGFETGNEPIRTTHHRLNFTRTSHAEKHNARSRTDLLRRFGFLRTALDQIFDRRAIAMTHDSERETLLDDVFGHAMAHKADANKSNRFVAHGFPPVSQALLAL